MGPTDPSLRPACVLAVFSLPFRSDWTRRKGGKLDLQFGNYSLDVDRQELRCGADRVPVEPKVIDLLQYLIRNRERVVSKDDLIANVWADASSRNRRLQAALLQLAGPLTIPVRINGEFKRSRARDCGLSPR